MLKALLFTIIVTLSAGAFADIQALWVNHPYSAPGKLYAVGSSALLSNRSQSLELASQRAKLELLLTLRTSVKGDLDSNSSLQVSRSQQSAFANSLQQTYQDVSITTSVKDIPGLHIAETYIDDAGKTIYALAELDLEAAGSDVLKQQDSIDNDLKNFDTQNIGFETLSDIQALGKTVNSMAEMSATLSSQLDATIDARSKSLSRSYEALQKTVFMGLSFGPDAQEPDSQQYIPISHAITELGLTWKTTNPRYYFHIQSEPIQTSTAYGLCIIRQTSEVILTDSAGTLVKSGHIVTKGVGINKDQASTQFNQQFYVQTGKLVSSWFPALPH